MFRSPQILIVFSLGFMIILMLSIFMPLVVQKSRAEATLFEDEYYRYLVAASDPNKVKWHIRAPGNGTSSLAFNQRWYITCIDDAQLSPVFDRHRSMNFPTNLQSGFVGLPFWPVAPGAKVYTIANAWGYFLKSDVNSIDLSTAKEKFYSRIDYLLNTTPSQRLTFNHTGSLQAIDLLVNNTGGAIIGLYSLRATHLLELMVSNNGGKNYNYACLIAASDYPPATANVAHTSYSYKVGWPLIALPPSSTGLLFKIRSFSAHDIDPVGGSISLVEVFNNLPKNW